MWPILLAALAQVPGDFPGTFEGPRGVVVVSLKGKSVWLRAATETHAFSDEVTQSGDALVVERLTFTLSSDRQTLKTDAGDAFTRVPTQAKPALKAATKRLEALEAVWRQARGSLKKIYLDAYAHHGKRAQWPASLAELGGVKKEKCKGPPRAVPEEHGGGWTVVCDFAFRASRGSTGAFSAQALALAPPLAGRRWSICSEGEHTGYVLPGAAACP